MRIEQYDQSLKSVWDEFVSKSKNGTFLFYRDYMDYHHDRFQDHSLLVWDEKEQLVALLPANQVEKRLVSHGGLTYGGFVTDEHMGVKFMLDVFKDVVDYLKNQRFERVIYKAIPHIYHQFPSDEDCYALFRLGATLYRRDVTTTVALPLKIPFQKRRERAIKKAQKAGVIFDVSNDYEQFWSILSWNLWTVHQLKPVHTVDEICWLQARFPDNIKLFCSFLENKIVSGIVMYETDRVAHAQYIASSEEGRKIGSLDFLIANLLEMYQYKKAFFNFGVSTENDGEYLNTGLIEFKEGFGGRTITHDFYQLNLVS